MAKVFADIDRSLDGFVAGDGISPEHPLAIGGERLIWYADDVNDPGADLEERYGSVDGLVLREAAHAAGAVIMERRTFDVSFDAWGEDPPINKPCFVLTRRNDAATEVRDDTTFTFVSMGPEEAIRRTKHAAGGHHVRVMGGALTIGSLLAAGLIDELHLHIGPVLPRFGTATLGWQNGSGRCRCTPERWIDAAHPRICRSGYPRKGACPGRRARCAPPPAPDGRRSMRPFVPLPWASGPGRISDVTHPTWRRAMANPCGGFAPRLGSRLVPAAFLVCAGEAGTEAPTVVVSDSAGVVIVEHPGPADHHRRLDAEPLLRLGSEAEGAPDFFGRINTAHLDSRGDLWVVDGTSSELAVFALPDGERRFTLGGRGDAPGEFQLPHPTGFDEGGTWIWDQSPGRLTVVGLDGELLRDYLSALELPDHMPTWEWARIGAGGHLFLLRHGGLTTEEVWEVFGADGVHPGVLHLPPETHLADADRRHLVLLQVPETRGPGIAIHGIPDEWKSGSP
jgi:dihydrofolate reductase